jgi:hypothetical protein
MINLEVWKDIKGYEGLYQVSSIGRIKSFDRIVEQIGKGGLPFKRIYKGRILVGNKHTKGYYMATLAKNKKNTPISIHRLVCFAFIPNVQNLPQVNHKNGIKTDNRVENLEWCTSSFNNKHAHSTGLNRSGYKNGELHKNAKLKNMEVRKIKMGLACGIATRELASLFSVSVPTISMISKGNSWKTIKLNII